MAAGTAHLGLDVVGMDVFFHYSPHLARRPGIFFYALNVKIYPIFEKMPLKRQFSVFGRLAMAIINNHRGTEGTEVSREKIRLAPAVPPQSQGISLCPLYFRGKRSSESLPNLLTAHCSLQNVPGQSQCGPSYRPKIGAGPR